MKKLNPENCRTKVCVRCFKKPKCAQWTGHVLLGKKKVTATWCSNRCRDYQGFVGHYLLRMGLEQEEICHYHPRASCLLGDWRLDIAGAERGEILSLQTRYF